MNVATSDPSWVNRDRFVMSAGHGSAMLYSMLHFAGFDISLDDLKRFRDIDFVIAEMYKGTGVSSDEAIAIIRYVKKNKEWPHGDEEYEKILNFFEIIFAFL